MHVPNNSSETITSELYIYTILDIILLVEVALAVVLNSLVIHIVWKYLWTPSNQLIFFLAMVDAGSVVIVPSTIASIVFRENRMQREFNITCIRVTTLLTSGFLAANCLLLTAIAVERFIAVYSPLMAKIYITIGKMQIVGTSIFIVIFICMLCHQLSPTFETDKLKMLICSPALSYQPEFFSYAIVYPFLGVSLVPFSCYTSMAVLLWKRNLKGIRINRVSLLERKTCLILFVSMFLYYVLYVPGILVNHLQTDMLIAKTLDSVVYINFFINPVVYWFHPCNNKAFKKIFISRNANNVRQPNLSIIAVAAI